MNGFVFNAYVRMVEEDFGINVINYVMENSSLKSGGEYTSVDSYDYREIIKMNKTLATYTSIPGKQLMNAFGVYFFRLMKSREDFSNLNKPEDFIDRFVEFIQNNSVTKSREDENPEIKIDLSDKLILVKLKAEKEMIWFMEKTVAEISKMYNFIQQGYNKFINKEEKTIAVARI